MSTFYKIFLRSFTPLGEFIEGNKVKILASSGGKKEADIKLVKHTFLLSQGM
jgi:hypothetical protein